MISIETLTKLLGGDSFMLREVGAQAANLYFVLRVLEDECGLEVDRDSPYMADGFGALVLRVSLRRIEATGHDVERIENELETLLLKRWIYSFDVDYESGLVTTCASSVDLKRYGVEVDAVDLVLAEIPEDVEAAPLPAVTGRVADRLQLARAKMSNAKASSDVFAEKRRDRKQQRKRARIQATAKSWAPATGAAGVRLRSWEDLDGPFGYRENKAGLFHLYVDMYRDVIGGEPVKLWGDNGRLTAQAGKLGRIANDYSVKEAMEVVAYCIENWDELQKVKRITSPPTPDALWRLRHDIVAANRAGDDPIHSMKSVLSKTSRAEETKNRGEWSGPDEEDEEWR